MNTDPPVAGNDSKSVQGSASSHGQPGLFLEATFDGSIGVKTPKNSGYSYSQQSGSATIRNSGDPTVSATFAGTIYIGADQSYTTGQTRNYTYKQFFKTP